MQRLYNSILPKRALSPGVQTDGAVAGTTVDRVGYRSVVFTIATGTLTDGVHTFTMEDSPDSSTWTAVAAGLVDGSLPVTVAASGDDKVYTVGYHGSQRYVRLVATTSGSTIGGDISAVALLANPRAASPVQ